MKKKSEKSFIVYATVSLQLFLRVTAANKAAAKEKALEAGVPTLCHQCASAGAGSGDEWSLNGLGDDVTIAEVADDD